MRIEPDEKSHIGSHWHDKNLNLIVDINRLVPSPEGPMQAHARMCEGLVIPITFHSHPQLSFEACDRQWP
jgi:hypothetical protein